ncbi:uncharacterized protein LOC127727793 [Mytilus californianus]|uniref:uncharacterized protein LOC127727793 n=1 Tax=Mytilus californianus TaxID=6549 RepID=UPI0022451081|nr:uncharacterized protein LOC127727793 [Mytilus californianus]
MPQHTNERQSGPEIKIVRIEDDIKRQFMHFHLSGEILKDHEYVLSMEFRGPLQTDLKGFYLSSYTEGGNKRYLATTQFQPTDARKAFPCFDEPEFKAVFNITVVRKVGWLSLSNTKIVSTTLRENGFEADHYSPTPRMSTYLVAFVVSQFKSQHQTTTNGLQYGVWAQPNSVLQTTEALNVGTKVITFYEDYFNISFPLPKQDMIAVPDYPLGAMENWGLITYRETAMLYDDKMSTEDNLARVTSAIAHELSHQWFGDLVTMKWWDDLWLNEGFATFVQYMGTDHVHPDWKMFDLFPIGDMYDAFEFDSVKSSHPIYVPVENPDQINEIFDKISYSKGGSVIRMIRYVLGEETFRHGLINYLNGLKYQSAVHEDLWNALQKVAEEEGKTIPYTVKDIMDTWILQMNYPVVMVTRAKSGLTVEQKRFLFNKDSNTTEKFQSPFNYIWRIPLTYTTSSEMNFDKSGESVVWLVTQSTEIVNQKIPTSENSWYLFNLQQYGVYRVNYDIQNWNALINTLKLDHKKIPVINRGQIINDAWNLAKAEELPVTIALETLNYLDKEMDYVPWAAATRELAYVDDMLSKTETFGDFQNFVKAKVSAPFNEHELEFSNLTHLEIYAVRTFVGAACSYGEESCVSKAKTLFNQWMKNPENNVINPNIKGTVYCTGVADGGIEEWNFVHNQYKIAPVVSEKSLLQSALSCTKEAWIINKLLEMTSDPNEIRKQDAPYVIMQVADNSVGKYLAKEFFYQNWDFIRDTYAGGFGVFIKLVQAITKAFNTDYELDQLKDFLASESDLGPGARAFEQAIENTESNIRWMKNNYNDIKKWLGVHPTPHKVDNVRLPRSLIPKIYNLTLKPDFYGPDPSTFSTEGSVRIEIECTVETNNITLHAVDLTVNESTVTISSSDHVGTLPTVVSLAEDKEREFLIVNVDANLQARKTYILEMSFTSPLSNKVLAGLYLSSYKRGDQTVYLATTQFESTDARRAFPCFDEPELKAQFKVTLLRKPDRVSLSNMPQEKTGVPSVDGFVADEYALSPNMSTYLLAIIVCDFQYTQTTTKNGIKYRAWSTPETLNQTALALKTGADTLTLYEDFFGVDFPIKKQDMIAIPDFSAGAMENWGLITYRETAMLFDPDVSSASNKQRVVVVITHELAHQWFGDLVTMEWWDDLWLNEGFATYVENFGTDRLYPEWRMFDQFSVDVVQDAFSFDGLVTSHPIYVPVSNPAEINEIFDTISYSKGGAIIRMMKFFLGDNTFAKGLTAYLKDRQFSNAFHDDLWNAMTKQAGIDGNPLDVKDIMDTWILQMNYPVVKVTRSNGKLHLEQKRFLFNPSATDPGKYPSPYNYTWKIPFTYTTSDNLQFNQSYKDVMWFNLQSEMDIPTSSSGWIVGNVQQYGYYRVNYDDENWQALIEQLKTDHLSIHVINRGQILNDVWSLSKSGDVGTLTALQVVDYLSEELDYVPWYAATVELSYVKKMLTRTAIYGNFQKYMSNLLGKAFDHYGLDNTGATHIEAYARSLLAHQACNYNIVGCTTEALTMYNNWMADPETYRIDPDLKSTVYCTGVAEGGEEAWDFLYQQYKTTNVAAEKSRVLTALACTKETYLISRYLTYSLDMSEIRSQDASNVIIAISRNVNGRDLAWDYVVGNWKLISSRYGKSSFAIKNLITGITDSFNTEIDLQKLKAFKMNNPDLGSGTRSYEQAVENTELNIKWMTDNYETLEAWLDRTISSQNKGGNHITDVRLPRTVSPQLYTLELLPDIYADDPKDFKISGKVDIVIDCLEATDNITIHINKLTIKKQTIYIKIQSGNQSGPKILRTTEDNDRQFYIMFLSEKLNQGQTYVLSLEFEGPLKDDLAGLYYSSYKRNDKNVYLAVTQFEATDARKAFPCFDEPNMKAKFKVTLLRKPSMTSISNMPQEKTGIQRPNGFVADEYKLSEKMSTYLLAFIVCDFKQITGTTKNNITYGAWSTPETINQAELALQIGIDTITFYEDFFGVRFPLPKQDMIAIPDFSAGAMENWGLITYRETAMLFEPGVSSEGNKQRVTGTITHELAHQWFGDLVTMDWWGDIWLNEGFARFVQYLGSDNLYPQWKMFEQFVVNVVHAAFSFDGLATSHPVYVPVYNPSEINEVFDAISYDKGASIIRMMKFFLGDSTFKKGLQNYLIDRKFSNAYHDDLWNAMANQSRADTKLMDVKSIMDTWTLQMNYPVVMVTATSNGLRISQKRYLSNPDAKDPGKYTSPFNYKWQIPFFYTTSKELNFNKTASDITWIKTETEDLPGPSNFLSGKDWIIANTQQFGFYRVNYDNENWLALVKQLNTDHKVIHPINRAQIINDAWNLAKSGDLDIGISLKTVEYISEELEYVPWDAASSQLSYVSNMLSRTEIYGKFKKFMKKIVTKPFKHFGMDNSKASHLESYIRSTLSSFACDYDIEQCTREAAKMFKNWMMDPERNRIDPGLKSTVYCSGVASGDEDEWNFVYDKYKTATVAAEKAHLLSALSCTKQTWILNRFIKMSLDFDQVRKQDSVSVFTGIHGNPIGRDLAWTFLNSNWDRIYSIHGSTILTIKKLISGIAYGMNSQYDLQQLREFKRRHPNIGSGQRALEQAIEKTEANIKWMSRYYSHIENWLDENLQDDQGSDYRLSRSVIPSAYSIELFPDLYSGDPSKFIFTGSVTIQITCTENTSNFTLNSRQLEIDENSVKIDSLDKHVASPVFLSLSYDADSQLVTFVSSNQFIKGYNYSIAMNFTGPLLDDLQGLYYSSYNEGNTTRYLASTQFESIKARKAFPCFDEPDLKAQFKVTLVRRKDKISLSNMPIDKTYTRSDGYIADEYEMTPVMSTYLLAFVVGDFNHTNQTTNNGIKYGVWSRPESVEQTKFALDVGTKVLTFYEQFFNISFPLPKQDMIAIPDFGPGAMENWGLITYKERYLLYKDGVTSAESKQKTAIVIAHELGHQWFGNLVTMKWWDDLWLNEGFATFMEYIGTDHIFPDWKMFDHMIIDDLHPVLDFDSHVTSHPIYVPLTSLEELSNIFDAISYSKGGSVIRMARFFLGEETFRKGLSRYLNNRKFQNADHNDLSEALNIQAKMANLSLPADVKTIMDTWLLQMNYPVVMVTVTAPGKVRLSQKRFLTNPEAKDPMLYKSPYNYKWWIPVTLTNSGEKKFVKTSKDVIWFNDTFTDITSTQILKEDGKSWVMANIGQYGVYRVNYTDQNWRAIINQLKTNYTVISSINRAQVINDAWSFSRANQLNADIGLGIVEYLDKEMDYVPRTAANKQLSYLDSMLSKSNYYGKFKSMMRNLVGKAYDKFGLNSTGLNHLQSYMRSEVSRIACDFDLPKCITEAKRQFDGWMNNPQENKINPDTRYIIYCTAIRTGGEEEWNFAYRQYKQSTMASETDNLLRSLACSEVPWILQRYLQYALTPEEIRKQETGSILVNVASSKIGRSIAWNFVQSKWDYIHDDYLAGYWDGGGVIKQVSRVFNTEFELQQLLDFGDSIADLHRAKTSYEQAIETVQANIKWVKNSIDTVEKWLVTMVA